MPGFCNDVGIRHSVTQCRQHMAFCRHWENQKLDTNICCYSSFFFAQNQKCKKFTSKIFFAKKQKKTTIIMTVRKYISIMTLKSEQSRNLSLLPLLKKWKKPLQCHLMPCCQCRRHAGCRDQYRAKTLIYRFCGITIFLPDDNRTRISLQTAPYSIIAFYSSISSIKRVKKKRGAAGLMVYILVSWHYDNC